ncbi:hypothetical protein [Leptolyngbya sp. AN10]
MLLAEVADTVRQRTNRPLHAAISVARKIRKKPVLPYADYLRTLERFSVGINEICSYWDYEVAISELKCWGYTMNIMRSSFDALLNINGTSVNELAQFGLAMGIEDPEAFRMMSEADLYVMMARRLEFARQQEALHSNKSAAKPE